MTAAQLQEILTAIERVEKALARIEELLDAMSLAQRQSTGL